MKIALKLLLGLGTSIVRVKIACKSCDNAALRGRETRPTAVMEEELMSDFLPVLLEMLKHWGELLASCFEHLARILMTMALFVIFTWHLIRFTVGLIRSHQPRKNRLSRNAKHPAALSDVSHTEEKDEEKDVVSR